jgi:flagella basal body P-ring formation protein FlgA
MKTRVAITLIAGMLLAGAASAAQVRLELKGAAIVPAGEIRMADVAFVQSDDPDLSTLAAGVSLGVTPLPGNARVVTREHAVMYLARAGVPPANISWSGEKACTVTIRSRRISGPRLVEAAREYLLTHPRLQKDGVRVEVLQTPRDQMVVGESEPELIASPASVEQPWGQVRVYVRVMSEGRVVSTVPVLFRITSNQKVLFALRQIPRGETVAPGDVEAREIVIGAEGDGESYFVDPNRVIGKKAVRTISAGAPISDSSLMEPYAIRRGEYVSIVVRTDHMEVVTKGVAQRDARLGEIVPIKVAISGKDLVCHVCGAGEVEMAL